MRSAPFSVTALLALGACQQPESRDDAPATYVGREACADCHASQAELWQRSHHDLAMQPATAETVLGDFGGQTIEYADVTTTFFERGGTFMVETDGADGELEEYEIAYTFGVEPLQQYLVPFPGGRLQALSVAWDSRPESRGGQRWFHLYPNERIDHEDPLHWTKRFQNWNFMCASCHSTGLRKNYELDANRYDTEWFEIDVSCEACHGPGSRHVLWAEEEGEGEPELPVPLRSDEAVWVMNVETGLAERRPARTEHAEIETCAPCHSRRSQLHEDDPHGQPLLDGFRPALLREPLYYSDGQIRDEVYVYGSFLQSKMYRKGVTCQDCHDPHALSVRGEGNSACAACHLPEKFDTTSHHFHEPGREGSFCVDCHMPETTYMVVDPRRDHSFRIPRPDLTASIGAPNACSGCHDDRTPDWAAQTIAEWFGHEPLPHYGEAFHAAARGQPDAAAEIVADTEIPAIVRASAAALAPSVPALQQALRSDAPLVRMGALASADALDPNSKHQLIVPLLDDAVRAVRIEAARVVSAVPRERFTPEQRGKLDTALEQYRAVQRLNADWPESHVNLALVHAQLGELDEAEREYRTALRLDPTFTRAHVNLADLYRVRGEDARGEAVLRDALELAPEDADVHHALGLALVRLERKEEALEAFARAAELRPDEPRYGYVYGVALQSAGDVEGALRVLRETSERHPFDSELLFALATTHRDRGDLDEALAYARRLGELMPSEPAVQQLAAQLEAARGAIN